MSAEVTARRTVGILAFDGMEVLDFAGPYEVFNVAGDIGSGPGFEVVAVGTRSGTVTGRGGFTVLPPASISDHPPLDVLIVPGGAGTRSLVGDAAVLAWVGGTAATAEVVVSVCTGALVLAAAGLLKGCPATTHHEALDELAALSPTTDVVRGLRFVQSSDRVWTSGGISAGIDVSLHLVALLVGEQTRDRVIAEMEWGW